MSSVENLTQEFSYMSPTKARSYYQGTTHEQVWICFECFNKVLQVVKPPPAVEVVDLTRDDDDDGFTLVQSKTSKKAAKTTLNKSVASGVCFWNIVILIFYFFFLGFAKILPEARRTAAIIRDVHIWSKFH